MITVLPVRTPTLPPATHTNVYRIGRCIIDPASPWPDEQARTLTFAAGCDTILLTHHHADHIGGVVALRDALCARVLAHPDGSYPFDTQPIYDGSTIDTGDGLLTAYHTPGHAHGHLAYALPDGQLVAGDLVAGIGTILIAPPEGHLGTYLGSLRRMLTIATRVHPAHGDPQSPDILRHYLLHRRLRTEQVRSLRHLGDAHTIAQAVYAGVPGVDFGIAALQVQAILTYLEETDGRPPE